MPQNLDWTEIETFTDQELFEGFILGTLPGDQYESLPRHGAPTEVEKIVSFPGVLTPELLEAADYHAPDFAENKEYEVRFVSLVLPDQNSPVSEIESRSSAALSRVIEFLNTAMVKADTYQQRKNYVLSKNSAAVAMSQLGDVLPPKAVDPVLAIPRAIFTLAENHNINGEEYPFLQSCVVDGKLDFDILDKRAREATTRILEDPGMALGYTMFWLRV